MALPKKNIKLTQSKIGLERRHELLDKINKNGTYLPKSLLHADLDGGFLDFVKNELKLVVDGELIPVIDIIVTTQNWIQFTETWEIQNLDKNVEPPFITVVRIPEVKFGTNPSLLYNIPNRRQFFYTQVPTWDGNRMGMDIYKIPQPVPVDINFQVKIICNRMRELNQFNKVILEKFASRQAYQVIKGHYIPIIMNNITDESVMDLEKRKYYIQSYDFTMLGFLMDENEFEVTPAISRTLQVFEVDTKTTKRRKTNTVENNLISGDVVFPSGTTILSQLYSYNTNISITNTNNISTFDVYINNDYYGVDLTEVRLNSGDVLKFDITKTDIALNSTITLISELI